MSSFKKFAVESLIPAVITGVFAIAILGLLFYWALNATPRPKDKNENPVKLEKVEKPLTGVNNHFSIDGYKFTSTNVCIDGKQILFVQQFAKDFVVLNLNEPCK